MNVLSKARRKSALVAGAFALVAASAAAMPSPAAHADADNPNYLTTVYDAVGSTHIGNQVNADMPLGPTEIKVTIDTTAPLPTPIVKGTLNIPSQVLNFKILDFIPARSRVTMTQVGQVTGTLTRPVAPPTPPRGALLLDSNVKYDIKLSDVEVKVFGVWWPLFVGNNCHTIDPVTINAKSQLDTSTTPATGYFNLNSGGVVKGNYTIGNFTGCTPLNLFSIPGFFPTVGSIPINALVPGSQNTVELNLSNGRYAGG